MKKSLIFFIVLGIAKIANAQVNLQEQIDAVDHVHQQINSEQERQENRDKACT